MSPNGPVALATVLFLTASPALALAATSGPTRGEYVETLEPICRSETAAHRTVLHEVEQMIEQGKLKQAAPRLMRASAALREAVKKVAAVPRPPADAARLSRWLGYAKLGVTLLRKTGVALQHGDRHQVQVLARQLLREMKRANATVVGFGFDYCRMNPSRFA